MVQVLTALLLASAISATTALESTPPDRKAPSGTSATMRSVTAARIRWTRCSAASRSEEHTSELQSLMRISYAVFCLKKKKQKRNNTTQHHTTQKQNTKQTDK